MTTEEINKVQQVAAMLTGEIYQLLRKYRPDFKGVDFRKYVTVTRADIRQYILENPEAGEEYFARVSTRPLVHDSTRLERSNAGFRVSWNDHGRPRFEKEFDGLADAIAEHVLIEHGLC